MSEAELDEAVERVKSLEGQKKKLMIKAVVNYIYSMAGDEGE
jgi:hypothetical protein